jgi:hypothetical protein
MMKHWLMVCVMVLGLTTFAVRVPVHAQSILQGAATCSQAADKCSDYCSKQFGGSVESAKCVDKCTLARAQCDRDGCFNTEMGSVCELSKR